MSVYTYTGKTKPSNWGKPLAKQPEKQLTEAEKLANVKASLL